MNSEFIQISISLCVLYRKSIRTAFDLILELFIGITVSSYLKKNEKISDIIIIDENHMILKKLKMNDIFDALTHLEFLKEKLGHELYEIFNKKLQNDLFFFFMINKE